jgi:Protein of unknown function DUF2625
MADLAELLDTTDPAWPLLLERISRSGGRVEVLPADPARADAVLLALQVSTRTFLGAVAHETGGLRVDGGWLRLLGAGSAALPRDLASWNNLGATPPRPRLPGALLVGDDVLGGFFAVNGGALPGPQGNVFYLAPDSLEWEDLERTYAVFLDWALTGDVPAFYEGLRWAGWEADVQALPPDHAFVSFPPLSSAGSRQGPVTRRAVPVEEVWRLHAVELPRQLHRH